jgi:hypothetical protein
VKSLLVLLALAATAVAQPAADPLARAEQALLDADYATVVTLAGDVIARAPTAADVTEAYRVRGLAHFFLHQDAEAEADFLAYLKRDLDGRLDPSTTPPEAVTFFEDVRARHAADLRKLRPRTRRWRVLDLLPPGGQIQNGDTTKAWVIGGAELGLLAADVTSYLVLRSWCSKTDYTCMHGGLDAPDAARKLRIVNYASGVALIGVYLYGVLDGFRGARHRSQITAQPTDGGLVFGASMSF